MRFHVTPIALTVLLAGLAPACAPRPDQIAPAPVAPQRFAALSCPQLVAAQTQLNRKVAALSAEQQQAHVDDIAGAFFTWRPLASLSGGNLTEQVALAKGELLVVNDRLQRSCNG